MYGPTATRYVVQLRINLLRVAEIILDVLVLLLLVFAYDQIVFLPTKITQYTVTIAFLFISLVDLICWLVMFPILIRTWIMISVAAFLSFMLCAGLFLLVRRRKHAVYFYALVVIQVITAIVYLLDGIWVLLGFYEAKDPMIYDVYGERRRRQKRKKDKATSTCFCFMGRNPDCHPQIKKRPGKNGKSSNAVHPVTSYGGTFPVSKDHTPLPSPDSKKRKSSPSKKKKQADKKKRYRYDSDEDSEDHTPEGDEPMSRKKKKQIDKKKRRRYEDGEESGDHSLDGLESETHCPICRRKVQYMKGEIDGYEEGHPMEWDETIDETRPQSAKGFWRLLVGPKGRKRQKSADRKHREKSKEKKKSRAKKGADEDEVGCGCVEYEDEVQVQPAVREVYVDPHSRKGERSPPMALRDSNRNRSESDEDIHHDHDRDHDHYPKQKGKIHSLKSKLRESLDAMLPKRSIETETVVPETTSTAAGENLPIIRESGGTHDMPPERLVDDDQIVNKCYRCGKRKPTGKDEGTLHDACDGCEEVIAQVGPSTDSRRQSETSPRYRQDSRRPSETSPRHRQDQPHSSRRSDRHRQDPQHSRESTPWYREDRPQPASARAPSNQPEFPLPPCGALPCLRRPGVPDTHAPLQKVYPPACGALHPFSFDAPVCGQRQASGPSQRPRGSDGQPRPERRRMNSSKDRKTSKTTRKEDESGGGAG